ncbi:DUF3997 domain-containing protein [Chryseobacterium sp. NKUCC03_KSP]|uniref:DUF3997 domain-containing protein n=1 Tax=Chryseobacterium sp. NKUCC03_KSP TaxID=2842125 RepID=UPI001C5BECE7|nr:DUF3997 domain-containing protein [Chryseobacterium sp. NKUCC03_KSP]MBW3524824.1 DUF3997 domain-containing protein [Chryseobacterium sp. NKUCC03_KSP]
MKKIISLMCLSIFVNSCAWLDESEHQKIIGQYEIGWNDLESNRAITKKIENSESSYNIIIDSYVFAVGHNESFIVAKQHQSFNEETNYYLIDIEKNKEDNSKGIYGPLNQVEFEKMKTKFNIKSLKFDLIFADKPNK